MSAYHNDPAIKARLLAGLQAHRAADEIVQGRYWEAGKGCAVGCALHVLDPDAEPSDHARLAELTGVPIILLWLQDRIFEGLPVRESKDWPLRFASAIAPGADLSLVGWQFLAWLVDDVLTEHGTPEVRAGCAAALDVVQRRARGEAVPEADARTAAEAAAQAAAEAAAQAAAARTVRAAKAAWTAAWTAAEAANQTAAAEAAAQAAAEAAKAAAEAAQSAYVRQAEKLIALIEAAEGD